VGDAQGMRVMDHNAHLDKLAHERSPPGPLDTNVMRGPNSERQQGNPMGQTIWPTAHRTPSELIKTGDQTKESEHVSRCSCTRNQDQARLVPQFATNGLARFGKENGVALFGCTRCILPARSVRKA